jgi:hypothetical protein
MARSLSLLGQIGRSITTPACVIREKKYFSFLYTNVHWISVAIIEMVCNGNGIHQVFEMKPQLKKKSYDTLARQ